MDAGTPAGGEGHPATLFLRALAGFLSTATLYGLSHPASRGAAAECRTRLEALLGSDARPSFSFLDEEVVYGEHVLAELEGWPWARRFGTAGVQRLEIAGEAALEELEGFAAELLGRLELLPEGVEGRPHPSFRYGVLGFRSAAPVVRERDLAPLIELEEESRAVEWIHERTESSGKVPTAEAAAVVRGLAVAMHETKELVAPLLPIRKSDQYTTAHCITVSILAMSLAEYLKYSDAEVHAIGEAALLHDIGKTQIPLEALNKPGGLTDRERELIQRHPTEGARILLAARERHALAAMVAYEHHMHWEGEGGYPKRHYPRRPHRFSRVVQVCDVYDALRTRRPFRPPLTPLAALEFLRQRAGTEFDPDLTAAFIAMMEQWEPATVHAEPPASAEDGVPDQVGAEDLTLVSAEPFDADTEAAPAEG